MNENTKILATTWRRGTICIVAVSYNFISKFKHRSYWQAYIADTNKFVPIVGAFGLVVEREEKEAIEFTSKWGDKLSHEEAHAFFPNLPIKEYKTYPGNENG